MTPKEKAEELIGLFNPCSSNEATTENGFIYSEAIQLWNAKKSALITVDEILSFIDTIMQGWCDANWISYWQQVKEEIEKI